MVRVPTYANYMNLLSQTMSTKSMVDKYSYQATTGIKYANYGGYGMTSANIVGMETSFSVAQTFIDNNTVLNTTVTAMSTVMETIENAVTSFKSQLNNSLSALSDLKNGEPLDAEAVRSINELQMVAYSGMSLLSDTLNTSIAGKYIFGAGSSASPTKFNFASLDEFQSYYDGINISYPTTKNAVLSSRDVNATTSGNLTISKSAEVDTPDNEFILSADKGFLSTAVEGGAGTSGTLTFSAVDNTLKSSIRGAFNTISAGDTLMFTDSDGVSKAYIVGKVSEDGKTITFSEKTRVEADAEYVNGYNDATAETENRPVRISTSFAIGTVVNFDEISQVASSVAPEMQIKGINDDGSLIVTADPSYFPENIVDEPVVVDVTKKWSLNSESYYIGGSATEEFRVSEDQSITMDISANDNVFNKLFRAFGMIAQGNMVQFEKTINPDTNLEEETNLVANADEVSALVNEAMNLLQSAVDNNGKSSNQKNETLSLVIAKVSANYVTLQNVQDVLGATQSNLEDSIYAVKNVDKTEASVKMLAAQNSLEASYQVLTNVLNLSLLNYMD